MAEKETGMRADAQANRDRILAVAREAFAAAPDASLNSIAKAAGIGAGTLYRHFPSREALILVLYRKEIAALVDLAPALLVEHPPIEAFRLWCDRLADYGRIKHGLADVIHATLTDRDHQETYWPMVDAPGRLLKACEASGDFRPGANPEDVLLLLGFLWRIKPGKAGNTQAKKLLAVVIDGLRAQPSGNTQKNI
jgi:AcrR family transcriptional regulator